MENGLRERLIGTWTLVSARRRDIPSGREDSFFGADPIGYINYSPEGRMIALLVRSDRPMPVCETASAGEAEKLFRSVVSYAGTYSVNGDEVTHHVDISWNELWTGTDQTRIVTFEGDYVHLSTRPSPDPIEGKMSVRTMTWKRWDK
jgi:hypothetical protein